ncbi:hypothetical protein BO70DRAFT_156465 [Aspergillus heteromorphus CBS 117.55]|uniref:Uncharacterized protein n=1 Tax=Aspergillus heteromorphus CBS 117.55 TaxID=1448321 RepID=A0A317V4Z4_9EURO|nr:uncharacterized protein BO70DRAFT_156465 [Aspergillus heteromorphus CBS 117.55]PWY67902.1 hypothetical protein BO70DRAFT_156465 [Aspergillus heteromorphus CBS 117.55]
MNEKYVLNALASHVEKMIAENGSGPTMKPATDDWVKTALGSIEEARSAQQKISEEKQSLRNEIKAFKNAIRERKDEIMFIQYQIEDDEDEVKRLRDNLREKEVLTPYLATFEKVVGLVAVNKEDIEGYTRVIAALMDALGSLTS